MKFLKRLLIILVLSALVVPLLSCNSKPDEEIIENQVATVQRGNLTLEITAAGNLALSRTEDLAIDLFYQQGTVSEVLVEVGDTVEEGQVLVTLDMDEWQDELSTLEDLITAKERDLIQAKINLQTAKQTLKNTQDNQASKELSLLNAQISLDQAQYNLSVAEETHTWPDLEIAEAEVDKAKAFLEYVLDSGSSDTLISRAQAELTAAEKVYNALVQGYDTEEVAIKRKQVQAAEMSLAAAQKDLDEVADDVALKELQMELTQGKLEDAEKALADAREDLEEAQGKSPEITAPFDGFITSVNVEGGDEVLKGTVAVQIADPEKFEAYIMVSEMDILQVKLDGEAWVEVDAMQGMSLPAKVTHIAPTATIQSGVVNYQVKVEIESLEAVMREGQEAMKQVMADIAAGEIPAPLQQAIDEGRLTREQVEEMLKQGPPEGFIPPEGFTPPEGMEFPTGMGSQAQGQLPTIIPEDFQLREGLTVTVTIILDERTDVLLVPNDAITSEGLQSYVEIVTASGETEKRAVQTGIADYQFTEITDGLSEGEEIIVPQGTVTTQTTEERRGGMMFFGGPPPPD
jgi:multidrug efflux pump subunit AcrA (membrane-fusion protein)